MTLATTPLLRTTTMTAFAQNCEAVVEELASSIDEGNVEATKGAIVDVIAAWFGIDSSADFEKQFEINEKEFADQIPDNLVKEIMERDDLSEEDIEILDSIACGFALPTAQAPTGDAPVVVGAIIVAILFSILAII
jgi:hypothetical protein